MIRTMMLAATLLMVGTPLLLAEGPTNGFRIIVNPENTVTSIKKADLSKLFLKKVTKWSNGKAVLPVDQIDASPVKAAFCGDILRRTVAAASVYWQQMVFSGTSPPPVQRDTDAAVVEYVKANPGAIGYVSAAANLEGVKEVQVAD